MYNVYSLLRKSRNLIKNFLNCFFFNQYLTETCKAGGHKGHMPLMNQIRLSEHVYAPSRYTPDKIPNSIFLSLMKKVLIRGIGADTKTSLSLVILPPLPHVCYALGADMFLGGRQFFFAPFRRDTALDENISGSSKNGI